MIIVVCVCVCVVTILSKSQYFSTNTLYFLTLYIQTHNVKNAPQSYAHKIEGREVLHSQTSAIGSIGMEPLVWSDWSRFS